MTVPSVSSTSSSRIHVEPNVVELAFKIMHGTYNLLS